MKGYALNKITCPACNWETDITERHIEGQVVICGNCGIRLVISNIELQRWVETEVVTNGSD